MPPQLQHPFKFFIDFIEVGQLNEFKENFFARADVDPSRKTLDKKAEWIDIVEFVDDNVSPIRKYFKNYITEIFAQEKSNALQQLDFLLIEKSNSKVAIKWLDIFQSSWNRYVLVATNNNELTKYGLDKFFQSIQERITEQKDFLLSGSNKYPKMLGGAEKVNWLGDLKTLANLFHDLYYGSQNNGMPQIDTTKENLEDFLAQSFLVRGKVVEKGTIKKYLQPGNLGARAKSYKTVKTTK